MTLAFMTLNIHTKLFPWSNDPFLLPFGRLTLNMHPTYTKPFLCTFALCYHYDSWLNDKLYWSNDPVDIHTKLLP